MHRPGSGGQNSLQFTSSCTTYTVIGGRKRWWRPFGRSSTTYQMSRGSISCLHINDSIESMTDFDTHFLALYDLSPFDMGPIGYPNEVGHATCTISPFSLPPYPTVPELLHWSLFGLSILSPQLLQAKSLLTGELLSYSTTLLQNPDLLKEESLLTSSSNDVPAWTFSTSKVALRAQTVWSGFTQIYRRFIY